MTLKLTFSSAAAAMVETAVAAGSNTLSGASACDWTQCDPAGTVSGVGAAVSGSATATDSFCSGDSARAFLTGQ